MSEINKELVVAALGKLSADNDNHWTADGKPKVETVKMFASGQQVDRAYLDSEFPDFNRSNPVIDGGEGATETTQTEPAVDGAGASDVTSETQQEAPTLTAGTETGVPTPAVDGVHGSTFAATEEVSESVGDTGSESGDSLSVSLLHTVDQEIDKLGDNPTQEEIDLLVHQLHAVQQGLHGRLKTMDGISARTAGQVKRESQAEMMRKMRESHGNATKTEETVEKYKYEVDQPRAKKALR